MKRLQAQKIFGNTHLTLIIIVEIDIQYNALQFSQHLHGRIQPIAIIVCDKHQQYAFDMQAKKISLNKLRTRIPESVWCAELAAHRAAHHS